MRNTPKHDLQISVQGLQHQSKMCLGYKDCLFNPNLSTCRYYYTYTYHSDRISKNVAYMRLPVKREITVEELNRDLSQQRSAGDHGTRLKQYSTMFGRGFRPLDQQ